MKYFLLLPVVLAELTACSAKKETQIETPPPVAEPAAPAATATAAVNTAAPMLTLPQVTEAVQYRQYDRAVQVLAESKRQCINDGRATTAVSTSRARHHPGAVVSP